MQTYLVLGNLTDLGRRNIQDSPKRLDALRKALGILGGKLAAFYFMLGGPYDFAAVLEALNDETIAKYGLAVAAQGYVEITVTRAFTEPEFRQLIKGKNGR